MILYQGRVLATSPIFMYNPLGRARRGTSGALNPKSAIAGSNSPPRAGRFRDCVAKWR